MALPDITFKLGSTGTFVFIQQPDSDDPAIAELTTILMPIAGITKAIADLTAIERAALAKHHAT